MKKEICNCSSDRTYVRLQYEGYEDTHMIITIKLNIKVMMLGTYIDIQFEKVLKEF